jgi:cell division septum initiation protein DivIVA
MQSVQQIYEENAALKEQVDQLEDELKDAQTSIDGLTDTVSHQEYTLNQTQIAMDYFWQIDESYVRGRYTLCRSLIEVLEDSADGKTPLKEYLPAESATDNGRFSPYDRYQEICDALN